MLILSLLEKALYLCKLARKQKEILYQGNECQNIFTYLTYIRDKQYGNIVLGSAMQVDLKNHECKRN